MLPGSASSVDVTTLLGFTRFLTNTLDNVNAFSDANIIALLNLEYREEQSFLLSQIMYDWKENTLNGTGSGLINLVSGTNKYAFPTGLLTLDRVEINYTGGSNTWSEANPVKLEAFDTAVSNTDGNSPVRFSTSSPRYWARDGYIYFDPVPNQSVTGGLKVWCTTLITDLAIGGAAPVLATPYHALLCYEPAIRWLEQKDFFSKANQLKIKKNEIRSEMIGFYSGRQADERPRMAVRHRNLS